MNSMKDKNAITLIVCPRPNNFKQDFRSVKYRDSPIVIVYPRPEKGVYTHIDSIQPLIWYCDEEREDHDLRLCNFCLRTIHSTGFYYSSGVFDQTFFPRYVFYFHKECVEPMANNPYHPKHSLQVLTSKHNKPSFKRCYCCYIYKRSFRYCSICDFGICLECVQERPLLTIDHKKRHEHTLSYIFREASMVCDVCGLDDRRHFIYACHQCDFVVHKECIYFPSIVKISRHEHRLSFTYSLLRGEWFCGVCREKIDENYGGYSCIKGCHYVVHSKCMIYGDVWDGKELEGEPEDSYEDITPLKEISEGIIQHFTHDHYMRLQEEVNTENRCQACALPVYDGDIFSCMECDFVLHRVCAYLPLKKQHAMHPHPLVLYILQNWCFCSLCKRICNSFVYKCERDKCSFKLDVHCASVSEPLNHQCHIHPLFLPSKSGSTRTCSICDGKYELNYLECGECDFVSCFRCATLPKKFMYKHDEHPLIFSFQKDYARGQYWCDVCEEEINPQHGVYMCNDCKVTLHILCLLGEDPYMLPGKMLTSTLYGRELKYNILLNNHLTRHICAFCGGRCNQNTLYKRFDDAIYCSMWCVS